MKINMSSKQSARQATIEKAERLRAAAAVHAEQQRFMPPQLLVLFLETLSAGSDVASFLQVHSQPHRSGNELMRLCSVNQHDQLLFQLINSDNYKLSQGQNTSQTRLKYEKLQSWIIREPNAMSKGKNLHLLLLD